MNSVPITVVGNLTDNPELRFTASGAAACRFSVAVNPRTFDKDTQQWKDGDPSYFRCNAWGRLAETIADCLHKGHRVVVAGVLAERHWNDAKTGEKRSGWEVTADAVGAELTFQRVEVTRAARLMDRAPDDAWDTASRERPAEVGA